MDVCSSCKKQLDLSNLIQSSENTSHCKDCFKQSFKSKLLHCEGDAIPKSTKMFTSAEILQIRQSRKLNSDSSTTSRRPLQCPHSTCRRYVGVSDLIAHFEYEHMNISVLKTELDERKALIFSPKDVKAGSQQCIALLKIVVQKPIDFIKKTSDEVITAAVLVSRIASLAILQTKDEKEDKTLLSQSANDQIIFWVSSNLPCLHNYTIAASTSAENIRLKYYGPVTHLNSSSKDLLDKGRCLILSHYHFIGMTDNFTNALKLDIIVHSED